MSQRGLGRGLDALFRNSEARAGLSPRQNDISRVHIDALAPNPRQPRRNFAPEALEELAASIRSQGLVQALLVRPLGEERYEIVAGERRWRAARLAGLAEVPVLVRDLNDMEVMAAALIENLQREDLNPLEEARALAGLREQFGLSQDELASTLGKSRPAVANALRLLNLGQAAQACLEEGQISAGHARALLGLSDAGAQNELLERSVQHKLTVREAEYAATLYKEEGLFPWARLPENAPAASEGTGPGGAGLEAPERPPEGSALPRRKKPEFLQDMQHNLRKKLKLRVSISGTESRGRISLGYQSQEELLWLLRQLGIENTRMEQG